MVLTLIGASVCVCAVIAFSTSLAMGAFQSKNKFPVKGRTVLVTGGSQGMGRAIACLLAQRGANVIIVARNVKVLQEAQEEISKYASDPSSQRFHTISADLTSSSECTTMISAATSWNHGQPPDSVICVAGGAHPGLFAELPPELYREQMETNYLSSAYTAHAAIREWLSASKGKTAQSKDGPESKTSSPPQEPKHLIFTSSLIAYLPLCGYSPYTPAKTALRALAETLSQELLLYAHHTPIQTHTVFPGTIYTAALDRENETKPAVTRKLEEGDGGQTAMQVAEAALKGLDRGEESVVTSGLLGMAMRASMMGWTRRSGWGVFDTFLAWIVAIIIVIVRRDMDRTVRAWGLKEMQQT